MTTKSVEQTYQVLSDIDHVRHRPGMYVGSINVDTTQQWVYNLETKKMQRRDLAVIPAFVKIFSEILDNAIDEYKRAPMEMSTIKVELNRDTGLISVQDNGRGFPCTIHKDTGKYVVETVFTNLRAGSNFDDSEDAATVGQNGLGATLTVILSNQFTVETADKKKMYKQTFSDGMKEISKPKITDSEKHGTKISFQPDYNYFKMNGLDQDHFDRLVKRVVDSAACNPGLKFYINGVRIDIKSFDDYVEMYLNEGDAYVSDLSGEWDVAVSKATDGYEQISFVNSVETYGGGEHVKYVTNQIVDRVRDFIKKKHKVDVLPGDIRNHMRVYISAVVNRPRFSSQTKENMISLPSEWKSTWTVADKFINKLVKTDIIQNILDWAEAKAEAALKAELRKVGKEVGKADPRRIEKFSDATTKDERHKAVIFLSEGDSAAKSIQGGRGNNPYIGSFPLRGKVLNVRDKDVSKVLKLDKKKDKEKEGKKVEPTEIQKIMTILGLNIGEPVEFIDLPDGEWVEISVNGENMIVNENDILTIDGTEIAVKSLL